MIAFAVDGPIPGNVSSCSAVAVLMLMRPLAELPLTMVVADGTTGGEAPGAVTGGNDVREGRKRGATVGDDVR